MNLLERAKRDVARIVSNKTTGFAVVATLYAPSPGNETAEVSVLHTLHHLGADAELQKWASVKNAHICVVEQQLVDLGYPTRDADGDVNLQFHKVRVADSSGKLCFYNIDTWIPDRTVGVILIILGTEVDGQD